MKRLPVIAIDGPAGAGKTSVARRLVLTLGFTCVETGAMYRAIALASLQEPDLEPGVVARAAIRGGRVKVWTGPDGAEALLDGVEVTSRLRSPEVEQAGLLQRARARRGRPTADDKAFEASFKENEAIYRKIGPE